MEREIKITATGCHNCKMRNSEDFCYLVEDHTWPFCKDGNFHPDCPIKEISNVKK